jgi:hypothetical protein
MRLFLLLLPSFIVLFFDRRVRKNLVGFIDVLKLIFIALIGVRMVFLGKISEGFFNLISVSLVCDSQYLVVIFLYVKFADRKCPRGDSTAGKQH